jgi:hypothetical protein
MRLGGEKRLGRFYDEPGCREIDQLSARHRRTIDARVQARGAGTAGRTGEKQSEENCSVPSPSIHIALRGFARSLHTILLSSEVVGPTIGDFLARRLWHAITSEPRYETTSLMSFIM